MHVETLALLQSQNLLQEPPAPGQLPPSIYEALQNHPSAVPFAETCFHLLSHRMRGEGATTGYFNPDSLWEEQLQDVADHTFRIINHHQALFAQYPFLHEVIPYDQLMVTDVVHDIPELQNGDKARSIPFWEDQGFAPFLRATGNIALADLVEDSDRDRTIPIMLNGKMGALSRNYALYEDRHHNNEVDFGAELFSTIPDQEDAEEFARRHLRFENRRKFPNDRVVWASRLGDVCEEIRTIARVDSRGEESGWDLMSYPPGRRPVDRRTREFKNFKQLVEIKSFDLSIGRLLEPAVMTLMTLRGEPEAQAVFAAETMNHLEMMQSSGRMDFADRANRAIGFFQWASEAVNRGEITPESLYTYVDKNWLHKS